MASTISDILKKGDNSAATSTAIVFDAFGGPWAASDAVTSRSRHTATTHATTGAFSQVLREGVWRMLWRIGVDFSSLLLAVPVSGTYLVEDLVVTEVTAGSGAFAQTFDDLAAVQAVTVHSLVSMIVLREDEAGNYAIIFIRSAHANVLAFTPDGVNVVDDAADARFLRQGVIPADL